MTDDELRVLELLSKGGLNAKQMIIGNSGTINYNDYGDREQSPKHEPKQEQRETRSQPLSDERRQLLQQIMDLIASMVLRPSEWRHSPIPILRKQATSCVSLRRRNMLSFILLKP